MKPFTEFWKYNSIIIHIRHLYQGTGKLLKTDPVNCFASNFDMTHAMKCVPPRWNPPTASLLHCLLILICYVRYRKLEKEAGSPTRLWKTARYLYGSRGSMKCVYDGLDGVAGLEHYNATGKESQQITISVRVLFSPSSQMKMCIRKWSLPCVSD